MDKNKVNYFFATYNRFPIHIDYGDGVYLFDIEGKKYLDFFGGLAVNSLGYNDADIRRAITDQIGKYIHLSNYFIQEPQQKALLRLHENGEYHRANPKSSLFLILSTAAHLARSL